MNQFKNKKCQFALAIGVALVALQFVGVADASAQDGDFRWILRGHLVHVWPGSDSVTFENPPGESPPINSKFWVDGGNGFNIESEYMFRPNIGAYVGLTFANMKTNMSFQQGPLSAESDDRVDMRQVNLGGNYHFTPESRFDFYAGVLVSWVGYSSSTFNFGPRDYQVKYDSELAWGFGAGSDFSFGEDSPWFASVQVKYMLLALEGDSNVQHLTVDPVQGYFGFGYRW